MKKLTLKQIEKLLKKLDDKSLEKLDLLIFIEKDQRFRRKEEYKKSKIIDVDSEAGEYTLDDKLQDEIESWSEKEMEGGND